MSKWERYLAKQLVLLFNWNYVVVVVVFIEKEEENDVENYIYLMKKEWKEMYTKGYSKKKSVTNLNSCRIMQTVTLIFFF